jgi:hypothetical protein
LNPWPGKTVSIVDSNNKRVESSRVSDKITFTTKPGESYTIKNSGISVELPLNPNDNVSIKMGNQIWMTRNLDVSTFRNGDPIPEMKTNEEWIKGRC